MATLTKDQLSADIANSAIQADDPIFVKVANGDLYEITGCGRDNGYTQIDHGDSPRSPMGILNAVKVT